MVADSGFKYDAQGIEEARYIIFAQKQNQYIIKVPKNILILQKMVIEYEKYVKKLLGELFEEIYSLTDDHALSDQLAKSILTSFGIRVDIL